ncbi:hypothetical protein K0U07_04075, partial [bacterium]|nr:hypothetical protein [bacterium]
MSNAILFHGEDATFVVKAMRKKAMEELGVPSEEALFSHGDYQEVMPTSKTYLYSMESIHSVVEESSLPPFRGKKRIIALLSADRMLPVHANALLKTLEDAPLSFVMYLTTTAYNDILNTILSRVQKVYVEGRADTKDYREKIRYIFALLDSACYDTFLKEIEALDKEIGEDTSLVETNLRNFLEQFAQESLEPVPTHLKAAEGRNILRAMERATSAFEVN